MALVRRSNVVGSPNGGQFVAAAVSQAPTQPAVGYAPVPRGPQPDGAHAAPPTASVAAVAAGTPANLATPGDAAAAPSGPASTLAVLTGFALVGLGLLGSYAFKATGHQATAFQIGNQMSAFGALFVFSAAVERVLEPFSQWLPGHRTKADYERAIAAMSNRHPAVSLADVAAAKAKMERARANRTVVVWGLATGLATLISAWGGFYLLHMLSASPDWDLVPRWVDALVTGLVVGSGTKPLHDVLSKVQKSKESAEDPAK
jgi:hypothetical protein